MTGRHVKEQAWLRGKECICPWVVDPGDPYEPHIPDYYYQEPHPGCRVHFPGIYRVKKRL